MPSRRVALHSPAIMSEKKTISAQTPDWLASDLGLVLPHVEPLQQDSVRVIGDQVQSLDEALQYAGKLINDSTAPVILGLENLSIEAVQAAVYLAEKMRGRLVLGPAPNLKNRCGTHPVIQTASLGEILSADTLLWVGATLSTVRSRIESAGCSRSTLELAGDLTSVLSLRRSLANRDRADSSIELILAGKRVAVLLGSTIDPRVESQWHKLAAGLQREVRVFVTRLPDENARNRRGAIEVVTWQTGIAPDSGAVDFSSGAPRPVSFDSRLWTG